MSLLNRYVFRQLVLATVSSLGGLSLALFPPLVLSAVSRLGGVEMRVVLGYLPFLALELFPYLLPLSFLLGVVSTFSRLGANGEWTAILMAGVHPARAALPALLLAGLCTGGMVVALHELLPPQRYAQKIYMRTAAIDVLRGLLPGRTTIQAGEFSLVGKRRVGNRLEDVAIRQPPQEEGQPTSRVLADAVEMRTDDAGLHLELQGLRVFQDSLSIWSEGNHVYVPFDDLVDVGHTDPNVAKFLPSRTLRNRIGEDPLYDPGYRYEIHKRNALAACYVVFFLLGVPIGLRLRTNSMLGPVSVAAMTSCLYYVVSLRFGKEVALSGSVPAWIGAWSANAVSLVVAGFLILRWRR